MTLEERVGKLEVRADELRDMDIAITKGCLGMSENVAALEGELKGLKAQLAELDVMVMAIHATIKDVQAKVTEQ